MTRTSSEYTLQNLRSTINVSDSLSLLPGNCLHKKLLFFCPAVSTIFS